MKTKTMNKTLLASGFALLACASMLIGTTYAWFTDSAQVTVNKIQVGKLDLMVVGEGDETTELTELNFTGEFAPGETLSLPPFYVKNNGSLQFKYKIVVSGLNDLNGAVKWTLPEWPDDKILAAGAKSEAFTISGTMGTAVGNEAMGASIEGIRITVVATQVNGEYVMPPPPPVVVKTPEKLGEALADPETKSVEVSEGTYGETVSVPENKELVVKDGTFTPTGYNVPLSTKKNSTVVLDGGTYVAPEYMQLVDAQEPGTKVTINDGIYNSVHRALVWGGSDVDVLIAGGTFNVWSIIMADNDKNLKVTITGGDFTLGNGGFDAKQNIPMTITGGTFNLDPTKYVNTGTHTVTKDETKGTWTVTAK